MEHRKQANNVERRFINGMEVRKSDDGKVTTLRGYAARFGSVYDMGWFTEEVHRDAFKNADLSDVRILFNHDPNQILGRTKSGTARVGIDREGFWYEVDLPESATALREAVQRGDVAESSWAFGLKKDTWTREKDKDKQHRVLMEVEAVYDASPVTFPANPDTSVAKRSLEVFEQEHAPKPDTATEIEIEIAELEHEIALIGAIK